MELFCNTGALSNRAPETIELLKTLLKYNLEKLLKKPKI